MPRCNNPAELRDLGDLSRLQDLVVDKRLGQRAAVKKSRRNRHCEKQFIRHALMQKLQVDADTDGDEGGTGV